MDEYYKKYDLAVKLINKGYLIHCTTSTFDEFNSDFIKGGSRAKEGYGFYFTDMPYKAIDYGDIFKLIKKEDFKFLNSSDNIDINLFYNEDIEYKISQLETNLDNCRNIRDYDYYNKELETLKKQQKDYDKTLFDYVKLAINNGAKTYGQLEYNILNPNINIPKLNKIYLKNGFDGYETDGIYTVFNFNKLNQLQIKNVKDIIQNILTNENKTILDIVLNEILQNKNP